MVKAPFGSDGRRSTLDLWQQKSHHARHSRSMDDARSGRNLSGDGGIAWDRIRIAPLVQPSLQISSVEAAVGTPRGRIALS